MFLTLWGHHLVAQCNIPKIYFYDFIDFIHFVVFGIFVQTFCELKLSKSVRTLIVMHTFNGLRILNRCRAQENSTGNIWFMISGKTKSASRISRLPICPFFLNLKKSCPLLFFFLVFLGKWILAFWVTIKGAEGTRWIFSDSLPEGSTRSTNFLKFRQKWTETIWLYDKFWVEILLYINKWIPII